MLCTCFKLYGSDIIQGARNVCCTMIYNRKIAMCCDLTFLLTSSAASSIKIALSGSLLLIFSCPSFKPINIWWEMITGLNRIFFVPAYSLQEGGSGEGMEMWAIISNKEVKKWAKSNYKEMMIMKWKRKVERCLRKNTEEEEEEEEAQVSRGLINK